MFEIEYKGGNSVIISSKKTSLYVDPKLSVVGLNDIKIRDGVQIATEQRFVLDNLSGVLTIERPGEYEVGDFTIKGVAARRHIDTDSDDKIATIYSIEFDNIRIGLLGNVAADLDEDQQEALGVLDILILPVGGNGYTLDATSAASIVRQLDPKVVIPVHYADTALRYEVPQDTLDTFTKELGVPEEVTRGKYKIKSAASLPQTLTLIALERG